MRQQNQSIVYIDSYDLSKTAQSIKQEIINNQDTSVLIDVQYRGADALIFSWRRKSENER